MTTRPNDPPALDAGDDDPDSLAGDPVPGDADLTHVPSAQALNEAHR